MTENEIQLFILNMIDYAQSSDNLKFYFLRSWAEYRKLKNHFKTLKVVLKVLKKSANSLFKDYCKDVISQVSNFNKLLAYHQLLIAIEFYEKEISVISDIIYEYDAYIMDGHFLRSYFGGVRPPEDLQDFRGKDYYGP